MKKYYIKVFHLMHYEDFIEGIVISYTYLEYFM